MPMNPYTSLVILNTGNIITAEMLLTIPKKNHNMNYLRDANTLAYLHSGRIKKRNIKFSFCKSTQRTCKIHVEVRRTQSPYFEYSFILYVKYPFLMGQCGLWPIDEGFCIMWSCNIKTHHFEFLLTAETVTVRVVEQKTD